MTKPLEGKVAVVAGATRGAGRGIARMLGEVKALFARVRREQKRLDVLVNVLTGPPVTSWKPF